MRTRLAEIGLSVQEYTAMSVLGARPGLSNAQLARRSLVTPQSMIEILGGSSPGELVVREVDPRPRDGSCERNCQAKGRELLEIADPAVAGDQGTDARRRARSATARWCSKGMLQQR